MYKNAKCNLKRYSNETSDTVNGVIMDNSKPIWKHEILDPDDGFAYVGQPVQPKQVIYLTSCDRMDKNVKC